MLLEVRLRTLHRHGRVGLPFFPRNPMRQAFDDAHRRGRLRPGTDANGLIGGSGTGPINRIPCAPRYRNPRRRPSDAAWPKIPAACNCAWRRRKFTWNNSSNNVCGRFWFANITVDRGGASVNRRRGSRPHHPRPLVDPAKRFGTNRLAVQVGEEPTQTGEPLGRACGPALRTRGAGTTGEVG